MRGQAGFFDIEERLKELSAKGDTLERLKGLMEFELFRPNLERAVPRADRSRGGRPPFEHVLMFHRKKPPRKLIRRVKGLVKWAAPVIDKIAKVAAPTLRRK